MTQDPKDDNEDIDLEDDVNDPEDEGAGESTDEDSTDPEDSKTQAIHAERDRRKAAEKKLGTLAEENDDLKQQLENASKPSVPKKERIADRVWGGIAKSDLALAIAEDASIKPLIPEIKNVLKKRPYLAREDDGLQTAIDIARGRSVKETDDGDSGAEETAQSKKQTSPARPKKNVTKSILPSEDEVKKMTDEDIAAREDKMVAESQSKR